MLARDGVGFNVIGWLEDIWDQVSSISIQYLVAGIFFQTLQTSFTVISVFVYLYLFLTVSGMKVEGSRSPDFSHIEANPVLSLIIVGGAGVLLVVLGRIFWRQLKKLWEKAKVGGSILITPRRYFSRVFLPSLLGWVAKLCVIGIFLAAYKIPVQRHALAVARASRRVATRTLVVLGVLLTVISLLATYVRREALDPDQFEQTSRALIANPAIQDQVAAQMVEAFYANVDVAGELGSQLPPNLEKLAGPIAGLSRELADRAAHELVQRPRAQDAFVAATSVSQAAFVRVLHGDTQAVETADGNVVLDLRPLVLELGDRINFVSNLADKIPQESAQVTILESEDLDLAQKATHLLEQIANWIWILAVAAWAAAIWLARGRRRQEVRALGIGLIIVGVLVLALRVLLGNYFVDHVVLSESVRPAASAAWDIVTQSLADSGWVALAIGVLVAAGAWLIGPGRRATAARTSLAPVLRRPEIAWASFVGLMILIVWILPIQMFRTTLVLVVAGAIGFVVLRRQLALESPEPAALGHVEAEEQGE